MGTCRHCNGSCFTLDRITGVMTCNSCGSPNYVGSPDDYGPPDYHITSRGKLVKDEYMPNSIFKGTKE